jgi:hypothetical protein
MLQNKYTTIVSEVKEFFTSSEKSINTILGILSSLTLSEKQLDFASKPNNEVKNITKLFLLLLFPFFKVQDVWHFQTSNLYPIFQHGKDMLYRFLNESSINWRKVSYRLTMQLIAKTKQNSTTKNRPSCLIIDDTDLPKTGKRIELIGKIFSHVSGRTILGFKGLFLGYFDGKSFFGLDFSLHGEKGKNKEKPYGLKRKELKARYSKKIDKLSHGYKRREEYFTSKIQSLIAMLRTAIKKGLRFDYVLVDSWFTCYELIKFINTRRIRVHFLGMAKMGKTRYLFVKQFLTAKEIIDRQKRLKKQKRSKKLSCYYSEAVVDFKGITVKLFFCKTSKRGKWSLLLSTNTSLTFEQAYKIYATRWSIEIFFKESKQYLGLGKNQAQNFDAQIAGTTIAMIQYNILSVAKRFIAYETIGQLFKDVTKDTLCLTVADKIWAIIVDILTELANILETEIDLILQKTIADNERLIKLINFNTLLKAG